MPKILFDGVERFVPDVYTASKVVSNLPGATRAFQVPVLLASADQGYPYNVASLVEAAEGTVVPWRKMTRSSDVRALYGKASDMDVAFNYGKKGGLPYAWAVCLSALTRASVIATSTGPVNQIKLFSQLFGAPGGWHKLSWTSSTLTVQPWKHWSKLVADAATGDYRVYVTDNTWIYVGMAVEIGDNATANASKTVTAKGQEIQSDGTIRYWVEFSATVGADIATADYAAIAYYDTADQTASGTLSTTQAVIDFINDASEVFGAVKHADYTGATLLTVTSLTSLKDISAWGTVTAGTSPAATSSDVDDFLTQLDGDGVDNLDAWRADANALPRLFCLVLADSDAHNLLVTWAQEQRADGYPVAFVTGCDWGDIVLGAGDDTDPAYRAASLNSQDITLCALGLDRLPAVLSLAPYVWGYRANGGVNHNLTKDRINATALETRWSAADLDTLVQAGVLSLRQFITNEAIFQGVIQGLSTLQANASAWNTGVDATTPLLNQRDIADFIFLDLKLYVTGKLLGEDQVTKLDVTGAALARGRGYETQGYIESGSFKVVSVELNSAGNGWDVEACFVPITTTDFITITTTILVGGEG